MKGKINFENVKRKGRIKKERMKERKEGNVWIMLCYLLLYDQREPSRLIPVCDSRRKEMFFPPLARWVMEPDGLFAACVQTLETENAAFLPLVP